MAGWEKKIWGRTRCVENNAFYQRHELEVVAGGFCSIHYHRRRANRFRVISGKIQVTEWMASFSNVHTMTAGKVLDVPSLVVHQFRVLESGEVIEEYWGDRVGSAEISTSDIVRLTTGGMNGS